MIATRGETRYPRYPEGVREAIRRIAVVRANTG